MSRPYVPLGITQQGRVTPTKLTGRVLDARQIARVTTGCPLPDLLLATGAMEGPFKRTHPITRWRLALRRVINALGRMVL